MFITRNLMQIDLNLSHFFSQVVFREDQEAGGGEEASSGPERARSFPDQGFRVKEERFLPLREGWRHREALQNQVDKTASHRSSGYHLMGKLHTSGPKLS